MEWITIMIITSIWQEWWHNHIEYNTLWSRRTVVTLVRWSNWEPFCGMHFEIVTDNHTDQLVCRNECRTILTLSTLSVVSKNEHKRNNRNKSFSNKCILSKANRIPTKTNFIKYRPSRNFMLRKSFQPILIHMFGWLLLKSTFRVPITGCPVILMPENHRPRVPLLLKLITGAYPPSYPVVWTRVSQLKVVSTTMIAPAPNQMSSLMTTSKPKLECRASGVLGWSESGSHSPNHKKRTRNSQLIVSSTHLDSVRLNDFIGTCL